MTAFGQQVDQACRVTEARCIEEGPQQSVSLRWIDRIVSLFDQMLTRSAAQLPRVGFAELEDLGDLRQHASLDRQSRRRRPEPGGLTRRGGPT
jgi:hypothetical protein